MVIKVLVIVVTLRSISELTPKKTHINVNIVIKGLLKISKEKLYQCEYYLKDTYQNSHQIRNPISVSIVIKGSVKEVT